MKRTWIALDSMFAINSPSEEEVLISRTIEKALRRSRAVDTEGLCIVAGEKVRLQLYIFTVSFSN